MSALRWGRGGEAHSRIPGWVLLSDASDRAVRLYCLLGRYADQDGKAFPSKPRLMNDLGGCARSTLDAAMQDLVRLSALEVIPSFREDGGQTANDYVLHWLAPSANSEVRASERPEGTPSGWSEGLEELEPEGTTTSRATALEGTTAKNEPPGIVRHDGRNLPFDAMAEVCGIQPRSPRFGQVAAAINGRRGKTGEVLEEGVTHLFFHSCVEWIDQQPEELRERYFADLMDPGRYSESLAKAIRQKAKLYHQHLDGATITPTALRNWWLDLVSQDQGGGLSSDDIRRFRG